MKTILIYTWGVFLAAIAGVATITAILMVFRYIDDRVLFFLLEVDMAKFAGSAGRLAVFRMSVFGYAMVVGFAVTVWAFELWRQRQHQIQAERRP